MRGGEAPLVRSITIKFVSRDHRGAHLGVCLSMRIAYKTDRATMLGFLHGYLRRIAMLPHDEGQPRYRLVLGKVGSE
ncbi:hypothetical protein D3Y55_24935 [Mesorhizobium sp. DCY119]|nr:hypothetical protein D3Y55_24935 [Mesorhizobium sp. DCY119]